MKKLSAWIGVALAAAGLADTASAESKVTVKVYECGDRLSGYIHDGTTLVSFESLLAVESDRPLWLSRLVDAREEVLTELHWDPELKDGKGWMAGVEIVPVPDWQYSTEDDKAMRDLMLTPEASLLLELPQALLASGVDTEGMPFRMLDANLLAYKAVPNGSGGCGDGQEGAGATDVRNRCGTQGGEVQEPTTCSQCSSHASCQSAGQATPGNGCLGQCGLGCGARGECSGACLNHDCCTRMCGNGPCPGRFIIAAFSKIF